MTRAVISMHMPTAISIVLCMHWVLQSSCQIVSCVLVKGFETDGWLASYCCGGKGSYLQFNSLY